MHKIANYTLLSLFITLIQSSEAFAFSLTGVTQGSSLITTVKNLQGKPIRESKVETKDIVPLAVGVTPEFLNVLENESQSEIGTCRNQNNRVSVEIISIEKVENTLGYNLKINLRINNYSNQPIRFALHRFQPELIGEQGQQIVLIKNWLEEPPVNLEEFYPEISSVDNLTFFMHAKLLKGKKKFYMINIFNQVGNYVQSNRFKFTDMEVMIRFKYDQQRSTENVDNNDQIITGICVGEFHTNFEKINSSGY